MIKLLRALFFLDAAIWLAFAVAIYMRIIPGIPDQEPAVDMMAALMLGNAAALAAAGWGLGRQSPIFYFFAVAVLVVNILMTITDQMGLWDWLTLALEVLLLGLLLAVGRRYVGVVRAVRTPRAGWDEQFKAMAATGDDQLLDADVSSLTQWDEGEWEW